MKKLNFLTLSLFAVLVSFSACDNMPEPDYWASKNPLVEATTIYSEDFGTTASGNPIVSAYDGYKKDGKGAEKVTYSSEGTVSVRTTSPSKNYANASGSCNAMAAAAGATLIINDIATCGATNIILSFGSNQTNDTIALSYKVNGTNDWVSVPYEKTLADWGFVENVAITLPTGANTIKLKFAALKTSFGARIDDIKIETQDVTSDPIVDADGGGTTEPPIGTDPEPVVSLTENFESFTAGNGNAYFSTQTDNKGWFGFHTQGELEADVREFSGNKYAQFSAHRSSITTSAPQEMWLLSPRLNLDAATSKVVSFDMIGGYFNASTVFEVYVIDGNTPDATKTKLSGFTMPTSADLAGSYTPFINSGTIDLSAFSGVKRIAFYYKGNSGTGNSTTYQLDNFVFGTAVSVNTLTVNPASLSFTKDGGAKTFTVGGNVTWNAISSDPTNFALTIADNVVTVTATATETSRTATITVTSTDGSLVKTVAINQSGATVSGANLVINGDFSAAWTSGAPTGWTLNPDNTLTVAGGNGALTVTNPTATTKFYQQIEVVAGKTYKLSYAYKATHARFRIWAGFASAPGVITGITYIGDAATDELRTNNGYWDIAADFVTKEHTFTVPTGQSLFQLEFRYYTQATSSFELKDVKLIEQ